MLAQFLSNAPKFPLGVHRGEVESVALAQDYSYTHEEDIDLASLLEDDWDVTDTGVTHSEDADFDDEICNVDDILSESIPLES